MDYDSLPDFEIFRYEDNFVDPDYPDIKKGVKFTPKIRGIEYSVYTIKDPRPSDNSIEVYEVIYTWCKGYYCRTNKIENVIKIDRDELLRTHKVAGTRSKK